MEFSRKPSDSDSIVESIELSEGHALLIADSPDYVNLPDDLCEGRNRRCNVLLACYKDILGENCLHYKLDMVINAKRLWVAKTSDDFKWHLRNES